MKKIKFAVPLFFLFLLIASCAQQAPQSAPKSEPAAVNQPSSIQPAARIINPQISTEVKQLLDKSKAKVNNIYYKYRGPETTSVGFDIIEFYVKGGKIKYKPTRELISLDRQDSYDVVYIDSVSKTAQKYCDDRACIYKGKKGDLDYNNAYISTIFDWINAIKKADKVGEEVIDDRNVWKVNTNEGILWLDTFYGIPLQIESNGKIYKFQQLAVNSVQDSDVNPSS